jgi:hypothetical protein
MKVLNQGSTRANDWYRHVPAVSKEELGITRLTIQPLTDAQIHAGLAGRITVQTIGGLLFVAIWNSKENDGTFYMTADNSEQVEEGKYMNSFIPSDGFRAYILQFVDAHIVEPEVPEFVPNHEQVLNELRKTADDYIF